MDDTCWRRRRKPGAGTGITQTTTPKFRTPQVILFCNDVAATATFYERLGFEECFRTPDSGTPIHIDLKMDG